MLRSYTNADGSIATYWQEQPAPVTNQNGHGDSVEINGETVSRAEVDAAAAAQAAMAKLPDLDSAYVPQAVSSEYRCIEMGGDPRADERDKLTRQAQRWIETIQHDADYDIETGSFIPRNPNDRDAVRRVSVGVLNLRNAQRQMSYLSALVQEDRARPRGVTLTAHEEAMLKKAEEADNRVLHR